MTCRKRLYQFERQTEAHGLLVRRQLCRGHIDDNGRCRSCGGIYGKRRGKPVEVVR
jgi:hypothetical protein